MKIDQSWYVRSSSCPDRISAGGVVTRIEQGQAFVALVREEGVGGPVLPKGGVEASETLEEAARREILEEAGLWQLEFLGKLGVRGRYDLYKERWITTHYFLVFTDQVDGKPTDSEHHYGLEWAPLDGLPVMFWPEQRELIETHRQHIIQSVRKAAGEPDSEA